MDMDAVGYTRPYARHFMVTIKMNKNKCWKTCPWLLTKAPSMLESLLNCEVSKQHINLRHPQICFCQLTAELGFSFGVAEPQVVQEPPGTVLCLWAGGVQGSMLATQQLSSCHCGHETLMAQHHFFPPSPCDVDCLIAKSDISSSIDFREATIG